MTSMPHSPSTGLSQTDLPIHHNVGGLGVSLLPRAGYETRHVATHPSVGVTLEAQSGDDAIGSDRIRPFFARPYTLAWIPAGCDVFSRSMTGGEYLKIEGFAMPFEFGKPCNDRSPRGVRLAARKLRCCILRCSSDDPELVDALDQLLDLMPGAVSHQQGSIGLDTRRIRKVLEMIESQLSETLSIESLAKELNLSTGYFNRAFRQSVGCTPHRYLMDRRLEFARHRLLTSDASLSVIALDSGFASHGHLSRRFSATYGASPSAFRAVFS